MMRDDASTLLRGLVLATTAALYCTACDRAPAASDGVQAPATPPDTAAAKPEVKAAPSEPAVAPTAATPSPPATPAQERAHFGAAYEARDAVVAGDLARAKTALAWLAGADYPLALPVHHRPGAAAVQAAVREGARAADLQAAAQSVAQLGAACGACHTRMNRVPQQPPAGFTELGEEGLPERMHRHGWAVERMWEGLLGPWDEAYRVGAQVIAEADPQLGAGGGKARSARLAAGLSAVRALGRQAMAMAHAPGERAAAYGELLATCAGCHAAEGVKLDREGGGDPEAPAD